VCATSGWNSTPKIGRDSCWNPATGAFGLEAVTRSVAVLLDPVAVTGPHGDTSLGLEPCEQPRRVPHRDVSAAVLALGRRRHFAAGQVGHELHAVANGEDRCAELEQLRIGGRGTGSNTELGPPERMMAFGSNCLMNLRSVPRVAGWISQ